MEFDFSNTKTAAEMAAVIPEGLYKVIVDQVEEKVSREKGTKFYRLTLKIMEGEENGRDIFDSLFFTQGALPRVKSALAAMGVDVSGKVKISPELIIGKTCQVEVVHKKDRFDEAKIYANVTFDGFHPWNPPAGVIPPAVEEVTYTQDDVLEEVEDCPF